MRKIFIALLLLSGMNSLSSKTKNIYFEFIETPQNNHKIDKNSCDCTKITEYFEKKYHIPNGLLLAIANVESMRRPWAVNNLIKSQYFKSREEAISYILQLEKKPQHSISVGYMQINWPVHKHNFTNLNEALNPYHNIKFAAKLLCSLYKRFGSWEKAIGWYNPKRGKSNDDYIKKVSKQWVYRPFLNSSSKS